MSDFDRQLRQRLTDQAAGVVPQPDLADLVERIAHDRSRGRRVSMLALALIVIVGPIAGFAVARASDGHGTSSASRRLPPRSTTTGAKFAASPLPLLNTDSIPAPESDKALAFSAQRSQQAEDRALIAPHEALTLGRLFERTSATGIDLRVYAARLPAQPSSDATACVPDRIVQIDSSDPLVSGITQGYLFRRPPHHVFASVGLVGTSEGSPTWIALVQSDTGTRVRASFADGTSDSTALAHGVAVLGHAVVGHTVVGHTMVGRTAAAATDPSLDQQVLHVEILDSGGRVVAQTSVTAQDPRAPSGGC